MAWTTVHESEQISLVADPDNKQAILELSSGGYRPRFVTLHLSADELEQLIGALQQAKSLIAE